MFQHQGIWLPDGERHFPEWMTKNGELVNGKGTYQIKKLRAAMEYVRHFRAAVDVGAHVGLWSMHLAARFDMLYAFEPVQQFRDCWVENMRGIHTRRGAALRSCALGAEPGRVAMRIDDADTGGTHVALSHGKPVSGGDIELRTLDSFGLLEVDFLKIDCEGYEHHVLEGALQTLERCRPCVIVEQKPHKLGPNFGITGTPAVGILVAMGAKIRRELSGDYILSWD